MTVPNSTPSTHRSVPDTLLPFLDTKHRGLALQSFDDSSTNGTDRHHPGLLGEESNWCLRAQLTQGAFVQEEQSILQAYASFVTALTGQDEVAFYATTAETHICYAQIAAASQNPEPKSRNLVSLQIIDNASVPDATLDFSIHLHTGRSTSSSREIASDDKPFMLQVEVDSKASICDVSLRVACDRASFEDATHLLRVFLQYIRFSIAKPNRASQNTQDSTAGLSILNYPPLNRPQSFLQDSSLNPVSDALLHRAFERRAAEHPDRIAIDYLRSSASESRPSRETYTYGQLSRLTDNLANCLLATINSRLPTGERVIPVLLSTSPELYISYIAVLKAGLAFCPLPTDAPTQRLQDIIDDLNPKIVLGAESFKRQHPSLRLRSSAEHAKESTWIDVEEFIHRHNDVRNGDLRSNHSFAGTREDDVCYVMYTSGSTGKPKGVQITHLAASCSIASHSQLQLPPSADGVPRWFQFAAPTFDPSLMEIFVTLSTGSTLCSASRDLTLSDLESTVSTLGASIMMSTPSMAALLRPSKMPSLRSLWTMGETLLRRNIEDFAATSDTELCNAYGPTEAAINCTLLPNFHPEDRGSIIGPALPTCSLFILDLNNPIPMPVPRGFIGELAIGGPQVSIGYLNRPKQTAKSFVESPEFGRLYRTGDKARIVTDRKGQYVVEFLGRIDDSQVKLSGRRVDLGEIDTVLAKCRGVEEAVTVSYKRLADQAGSEEAVAFIILKDRDQEEAERECREATARQLPSYMCPTEYFFLGMIPRSSAGKVDRKALRLIVDSLHSSGQASKTHTNGESPEDTPEHELETRLCSIISEVLGGTRVMTTTNLFSVGVDSLRAVRCLQRLRDSGINELGIVDVLRNATPRTLADLVMERRKEPRENGIGVASHSRLQQQHIEKELFYQKYQQICADHFGVGTKYIEKILPTTATQSGMLASFLRSSGEGAGSTKNYIHHSIHHINSSVDVQKLQKCWDTVLQRHDAYRMVFLPIDDTAAPFMQCILSSSCRRATKSWKEYRLKTDADETFQKAFQDALSEAEKSITLDRPPFQMTLVTTPNRKAIACSLFHGIFDGASLQLLFDEVTGEYFGASTPSRTEISAAVDMHFNSDAQRAIEFWTTQMEGCELAPFPNLTGLRPEASSKIPMTTTYSATIDVATLRNGAANAATSPLAILQAAWSLLLITYKDSWSSSTFGSVVSGRLDSDSELCVGPTFTTIPVTIPAKLFEAQPHASNASILQHLTELNAKSLDYLQVPLNSVLAPGGGLYYDTLLAYQGFASGTNNSELWDHVEYPAMGNDFAVMIEVWPEADGRLRLRATYTNEYLDEPSALLMLQQFNGIVAGVIQHPERPYLDGRFSTLSQLSSQSLIPQVVEDDELLHGSFESHAMRNPDDIALVFKRDLESGADGNIEWTYGELDLKANRLASYLTQTFGCLRDLIVPFSLEKSPELYVAILGILKAGAAWCPIDPAFPADRCRELITRTDAKMLLVANNTLSQDDAALPEGVILINLNSADIEDTKVTPNATLTPHDMAYLIWTSGTTGLPKGVMVEHHSAAAAMKSLSGFIHSDDKESIRCLQFSQPTFDVFVQDLFYTWGLGGTVISATKDIMLGSFPTLANEAKATHAHLTPAFAAAVPRNQIKTLQIVTFIGEALPQPIADDWGQDMIAYNTYGPAEVSVVSTVRQFAGCANDFKSANIGYTLATVSTFVINDDKIVIKQGVGELALAGPQVARGYWKDTVKTLEKFHWNESAQAHVYMTGDIVRQLHDGSFEFVGRRDDLVKLNGMRVELSEISFALGNCHPEVEQVVTMHMARPDRPTKVVVVFLSVPSWQEKMAEPATPIIHAGASELANTAMSEARRKLPEHMVPSVVMVLSSIPMTASAKIDRVALAKAYESLDIEAWENMISPAQSSDWTEQETALLEHVSNFSGANFNSINRTSRLATLGIDSIGAIRLAARLKISGYALSTAYLLQSRTIGDLCLVLTRLSSDVSSETSSDKNLELLQDFHKHWHPTVSEYLKDTTENAVFVCPALPMQENLLSETFRNPQAYWSNHFFTLSQNVNVNALENAWKIVASQNDALRVSFVPTAAIAADKSAPEAASTFIQVIYNKPFVDFSVVEVTVDKFPEKAKQRARDVALKRQEISFLRPCWAVTMFECGESTNMMFSVHHSIHDGPSLSFIMQDLHNAYINSACALEPRQQLREAVAILTSSIGHSDIDSLNFWEPTLQDFVAEEGDVSEDKAKPKTASSYNTATVPLSIPYLQLQTFTQQVEASSITSILRAAWGCTVADFLENDNKNVVLGEVLSERALLHSLDNMIGPLVTLVPAPVCASGSAREIVKKNDETMVDAWKHRNISPGALRRLIKRPKNQPLYPAVFVFHPYAAVEPDHRLWTETEDIIGLNVEHELTLNVEERADGSLDLVVSAEASVLGLDGVELLTKQLDALITAMVKFPHEHVSELTNHFAGELLSKGRSRELVANPIVAYDNPLCWFDHWAQVSPDWPAVEIVEHIEAGLTRTVSWTFSELNHEANLVCAFIQSLGVHERMIGMCLGRTLAAFAVTVGIYKSGNTYLPIDEDLPKERKLYLLQDSNAAIFFTHRKAEFTPPGCKAVDIDRDQYRIDAPVTIGRNKDDVAYLLYTSGSTGNPKGVLISNSNLTAFCEAQSEFICHNAPATLTLGGTGKWLGLASRAFDVHVAEMFLAWRHGLCAVTGKRSMLLDDLALALKELKVTHASFVPSLLDQVGLVPSDVPLLRFMSVGGEKISQRTLEAWGDSETVPLVNAYGPTECTIGCCSARVSSKSNMRNIGKPLGDSVAHVLVPGTLTYAKRGMEGELCFTGSLVGLGYHKRDTGAFVEDFHGERMYRTGDLVRMMPDGSIEIFGRSDDQTKIRGQRLELGEVSECVRNLSADGTYVASLITKHPELSRMQLVSFVAQSRSGSGEESPAVLETFDTVNDTIRSGCKERLPSYMVPDIVVPLNFLPLAATSGKADVKLLKKLFSSIPLRTVLSAQGSSTSAKSVESRELNEDEKQIAELLKAVLRGADADIQPSTNIFEIGVDSLVAISLATLMRKHGYDCTVADVLSTDTVADLALFPYANTSPQQDVAIKALVKEKLSKIDAKFRASPVGIKLAETVAAARPCLPIQEAVVARSLDKEEGGAYVNHIVLELSKNVNVLRFKQAWEAVIMNNEIPRTCFCQAENDILQVVLRGDGVAKPWTEVYTDEEDRLAFLKSIQDGIAREIVDKIDGTPPMRLLLLNSDDNYPPLFCVSMHHALYDAEALSMLLSDVYSQYMGLEVMPRLTSEPIIERILSVDEDAARQYWTEALQDYQCPGPQSELQSNIAAKICTRTLKSSLTSLETKAASLRVTLPTLSQTAFGIAMAKASSINDFIFGLVLSGRSIPVPGVEDILAPTITTVPQRIDLRNSSENILDVLSSVQKSSGKMLQFQHTSLRAIHKWVKADYPLFNCLSSFIRPGTQPSYEDVWTEIESYMPPDYPMAVEFEANAESNELIIRAGYTLDFGSDQDMANLLEMIELLIDTISADSSITVNSLGIERKGYSQVPLTMIDESQEFSVQEQKIKNVLLALGGFESEHISRHSTFFRLGVDSVIAIRFAQQLRAAGLKVSSSDIARYPSIAQLSDHISTKNQAPPQAQPTGGTPSQKLERYRHTIPLLSTHDTISQLYACTPLQAGLLTQTVASGGTLYVHHPTVQLAASIDLDHLKSAWIQVLSSLDILRTSFHYTEESEARWIAAVHENPPLMWNEIAVDNIEAGVRDIVSSTNIPSTETFSPPPVKVTILKSSAMSVLVLSLHHSLYDGWSLPLIFDALSTAYTSDKILSKSPFSTAATLIADRQQESVDFWLKRVEDYTPIDLPASGLATSTFSGTVTGMTTTDILDRCKAMNVNLQSVTLLAYGKALCCLVQRKDIVFGHVVSGRSLPVEDIEQIIGPLFNTVPFRALLDNPLSTNEDVVKMVQQTVVDGQEYQHASLNTIQKLWRQSQNGSDASLIDALFVFQKAVSEDSASSSDLWTPFEMEDSRDSTEYGLNVEFEQGEHELTLSTASSRLNRKDLESFCKSFDKIMQDILNAPSRSVTAYPENLQALPLVSQTKQPIQHSSNFDDVVENSALPIVRKAFSDVSQIPEVNINLETSIFSLGIDSIAAIRVASNCREKGIQLGVADILQGRCIGGIVRILITKQPAPTMNGTNVVKEVSLEVRKNVLASMKHPKSSVEQILPCLAGQVYHLASWLVSGRTFYEPTWALRSRTKINPEALGRAWLSLQCRHAILRTVFVAVGPHEPYQVVLRPESLEYTTFAASQTSNNLEDVVKQEVRTAYAHPSTLLLPPISLILIQGAKEDAVLIKLHHSLYDAWTMTSLITELSDTYRQRPPPSIPSFPDFTWHTRDSLTHLDEASFWKSALSNAERSILLPPTTKQTSTPCHKQTFVWVRGAVKNLKKKTKVCQSANIALSTVVIQAFARVLGQYTNTSQPTFGFFHTGRSASFPGTAQMPGPCVNLLPMSIHSEGQSDLETALQIQEELSNRVPFEQSYLRDILCWKQNLDPASSDSRPQPLFNASLNLLWHSIHQIESESEQDKLLEPMDIGVPTDFASEKAIPGETAVDRLETAYLAKQNLFVDVGPVEETDSIDFGVKCDFALMGEEELRMFVEKIAGEIERIVGGLGGVE